MQTNKIKLQLFGEEQAQQCDDAANETQNTLTDSNALSDDNEFEALIKGKYSAAFNKRTQGIIDKRFAKLKQSQKDVEALKPIEAMLREKYPQLNNKPVSELVREFTLNNTVPFLTAESEAPHTEDSDNVSDKVSDNVSDMVSDKVSGKVNEQSGVASLNEQLLTPAENIAQKAENAKADKNGADKAFLAKAEQSVREAGIRLMSQSVIDSWKKDEQNVKSIYPDFSLRDEICCNTEFSSLLCAGVPLIKAYECANLNSVMASAMRYAAINAGRKMAGAVKSAALRPQENGVLDRAASFTQANVNSLTEKDIMSIIDKVSRGAKITFR